MNKQRILRLIFLLQRYSDMDHKLKISQIFDLLEKEGIPSADRKTLYDDFKILGMLGYDVEYDEGYYLGEAPFSVSEIKIIIDSLDSLKNLDRAFLEKVKDKLYSFLSVYEEKDLRALEYHHKHKDVHFINRLEDSLEAIRKNKIVEIRRAKRSKSESIVPLFLYRENDHYYLYYHYVQNEKIYHVRFDNLLSMKLTEESDSLFLPLEKVLSHIEESSSSFHTSENVLLRFQIMQDSEYLRSRLQDDFPNIVFTRNGFSARVSVSDAFFARLTSYGDQIKISDPQIAERYIAFLSKIITRNNPENRSNRSD
ncbi:MAG: WYL domain-containing protein [Erysipelotrichaceae bacterium]|nr:WYL domain-containing protein [Erysipelotrichaceae bacterium]